jgi:hypothetical protein
MARQVLEAARPQTRTQFRDGLAAVKDHHGATGDITVGPRRTAEKALFFMTVDRGGLREMKPEELQGAGAGGS